MTGLQATTASTMTSKANAWDTLRTSAPLSIPARREQRRLLTDPIVAKLPWHSTEIRVESSKPEPAWLYSVLHRLQNLSKLTEGWDSYGGRSPTDESAYTTLVIMARVLRDESVPPLIFPTSDGGLQLEWHSSGEELEIRVGPNGEVSAFRFDEQAGRGEEVEQVTRSDLSPLLKLTGTR